MNFLTPPFLNALAGLLGGTVRGLVGITKAYATDPKNTKLQWRYFAFSVFVSCLVGLVAGLVAADDWKLAIMAGYAGSDFLENLYKVRFANVFEFKKS